MGFTTVSECGRDGKGTGRVGNTTLAYYYYTAVKIRETILKRVRPVRRRSGAKVTFGATRCDERPSGRRFGQNARQTDFGARFREESVVHFISDATQLPGYSTFGRYWIPDAFCGSHTDGFFVFGVRSKTIPRTAVEYLV